MSLSLGWHDPWLVAVALAEAFGREGLVWLDGDGSNLGRWGWLGVSPSRSICCRGLPGEPGASDPFAAFAAMVAEGGDWLGWLGYEAGAWVEPGRHWRSPAMATLWAGRFDALVRFDLREQRLEVIGTDRERRADLAAVITALDQGSDHQLNEPPPIAGSAWHWHTPEAEFVAQVERIKAWIACGDLFQANLSACCETLLPEAPDPLALYSRLRRACPAPFSGLAIAGPGASGEALLSASPERFLQLEPNGQVESRPIKGTRPRHRDPDADADAAAELITSPKDRAENVMIVDLLRNDLGRVCAPGSISVPQLVGLESYPQVHHLTSVVVGQLRQGAGLVELLRACWPGGSITGAPKVRACQRLNELEPLARGPYCGSLFRLGGDGHFDSNLLIRSLMLQGQRLRAQAGCGIVADSDSQAEAEELSWKLRPLLEALGDQSMAYKQG